MKEKYIRALNNFLNGRRPDTLLILGSGLGKLADDLKDKRAMTYADLGFPASTVSGHDGRLSCGFIGSREVLCMQGRFHLYEGYDPALIKHIIGAFAAVGIKEMIVTNAAGSLRADMPAGSLMLINDHINLSGRQPLLGPNNDDEGPRFPAMAGIYDAALRQKFLQAAAQNGTKIYQGVYLMTLGPTFETAAEVNAFRILGADAVGMSTVPEVIAAAYHKIKVLGVSVITNLGAGLQQTDLSHEETLQNAAAATEKLTKLLQTYMEK